MPSLLEQLDRESLLLMYLGEELSQADREEIERRLSADPGLAATLSEMRALQYGSDLSLSSSDARTALPMTCETAVRRASRAMKQWQVDRLHKPPAGMPTKMHFRLPWWSYFVGVAASIIIGVLVWSSNIPEAGEHKLSAQEIKKQQEELAQDLEDQLRQGWYQEADFAVGSQQFVMRDQNPDDLMSDVFMRVDNQR
jgi:anti-sigma factor RsiW